MSVKMALRKRAAARVDLTLPPPPPSPPKSPTGSGGGAENGHRSPSLPPVGERRRTPPPPPVARRVVISQDLRHAIKELRAVPVLRCPGTVEFLDDVDFGNRNGGGGGNVEIGSSSTGVPDGGVSTGSDRMFESSAPSINGVAATDSFQSATTIAGYTGSLTTTMLTTTATKIWSDTTTIRSTTTTSTSRPCKQFVEVVELASPPGDDAETARMASGGERQSSQQLSPPSRDLDVVTPTTADDEVFADDWKLTAVRRAAALGSTDRHDDEDFYEQAMDELDSIDAEVVDVEPQSAPDQIVVDATERDGRSPADRQRDDGRRRTQEQLVLSTYREVTRLNGEVSVGGTTDDQNGVSGRASGAVASTPADDVDRASSSRNVDGADVVEVWTLADWTNLQASSPLSPNDDTSAEELFEEIMESMKGSVEEDDDEDDEVVVIPSDGGTVDSPSRIQNGGISKTAISTSSSTSESPPTTVVRRPRSTADVSSGATSISTTTMTTTTETAQVSAALPTHDGPMLRSSMDETLKQKILNERLASVLNECLDVLTVAALPTTADRNKTTTKTNASVESFQVAVPDEKISTVSVLKTQRPPTSFATARSTVPQNVRRRSPIDIRSPSASCDIRRTTSSSTTSSGRERGSRTSTSSSGIQSDDVELDVDIDEEFGANAAFDVDGRRTVISNESLDSLLDSLLESNVGEQMMAERTLGTFGGPTPTPRVSRTSSRTASGGRSGTDPGRREEKENDASAVIGQQKASSAVVDVRRRSGTNGNVERTPDEVALVDAEAKAVAPYSAADKSPRMEILSDELITQEIVLKIAWPKAGRRKMPPTMTTTTKTTNRSSSKSKATKGQLIPVSTSNNVVASTPSPFRDLHVHRVIRITDVDGDDGDGKATSDRRPIDACGDDVPCPTRIAVGGPLENERRLAVTTDLAAAAQNGVDACVELDRRATSTTSEEQPDGSRYQVVRADRMRVVRLPVVRATDADQTGSHVADGGSGGGIGSVVDEFGRALVEERRLRHLPADIRVTCEAVERRSANDDVTVVHRTLIDDVDQRPSMVVVAPRPPASTLLTTAVD